MIFGTHVHIPAIQEFGARRHFTRPYRSQGVLYQAGMWDVDYMVQWRILAEMKNDLVDDLTR